MMKQPTRDNEYGELGDRFDTDNLRTTSSSRVFGRVIEYSEQVTSTNDVLLDLAEQGAPHGAVCLAEEQTAGRGRRGHGWFSPPRCGIWTSILLRPRLPAARIPPLTLYSGVALARALEERAGVTVEIKWPNDLLIRNRKVAGILAETRVVAADELVVVIGMGINVNHTRDLFPEHLSDSATSLRIESGETVSRQQLFLAILASFESAYECFLTSESCPHTLLAEVNARLAWRGRMIEADSPPGTTGRLSRVDEDGGLLLERKNHAPTMIRSGSIRLRFEQ